MFDTLVINTKNPTWNTHEINVMFIEYVFKEIKMISKIRTKHMTDMIIKTCDIPSFKYHKHQLLRFQTKNTYTKSTVTKVEQIAQYLKQEWGYLYLKFCKEYELN